MEAASRVLRGGDLSAAALASYETARRIAFADKSWVTWGLQQVIRHRMTANLAGRVLARRPVLLDTLLGVIGDYVPPGELLRGAGISM